MLQSLIEQLNIKSDDKKINDFKVQFRHVVLRTFASYLHRIVFSHLPFNGI